MVRIELESNSHTHTHVLQILASFLSFVFLHRTALLQYLIHRNLADRQIPDDVPLPRGRDATDHLLRQATTSSRKSIGCDMGGLESEGPINHDASQ